MSYLSESVNQDKHIQLFSNPLEYNLTDKNLRLQHCDLHSKYELRERMRSGHHQKCQVMSGLKPIYYRVECRQQVHNNIK